MLDLVSVPVSVYSLQGVPAFVAKYTLSQVPVSREKSTSYLTDCERCAVHFCTEAMYTV